MAATRVRAFTGTVSRANVRGGERRRTGLDGTSAKVTDKEYSFIETKGDPLGVSARRGRHEHVPLTASERGFAVRASCGFGWGCDADRADWLKADMTLRSQHVDPSDSLLLVRQEKIL